MSIIVSGTPGTGKTTVSKALAKKIKYTYLDVSQLIKENKIADSYDKRKKCYVVDIKKLNKALISIIKKNKNIIIDSHLSHYLPKKYVDFCIITKCNLKELEKRLKKKEYSKTKIRENLDCEIFDICLNEAIEAGHKIIIVDTTKKVNLNKIKKQLKLK
jgi:adenylate kinase